jgi:hypothetical protein
VGTETAIPEISVKTQDWLSVQQDLTYIWVAGMLIGGCTIAQAMGHRFSQEKYVFSFKAVGVGLAMASMAL